MSLAYVRHKNEWPQLYNEISRKPSDDIEGEYDCIHHVHVQKTGGSSIRRLLIEFAINSGVSINEIYAPGELGRHKSENISLLSEDERKSVKEKDWKIVADHSELFFEKKYGLSQFKNPFRFTMLESHCHGFPLSLTPSLQQIKIALVLIKS